MFNIGLTKYKMATEVEVKKIGNSLGVLLPKDFVRRSNIRPREKIIFEVVKKADLDEIFGSLKRKVTGKQFKDLVKAGWF